MGEPRIPTSSPNFFSVGKQVFDKQHKPFVAVLVCGKAVNQAG
jgi:hypothetical protein